IINRSEVEIIFVGNEFYNEKIKQIYHNLNNIPLIFCFDEIQDIHNFDEIIALGVKRKSKYEKKVLELYDSLKEDEMCSLIYTSGTTGLPKGVMLSHKNFLSNVQAAAKLLPLTEDDNIISFLPISHVLERMLNYLFQYKRVSIYYAESIEKLIDNIKEVNPAGFGSVPRLIEKIYTRLEQKSDELKGFKKYIYKKALELAESYEEDGIHGSINKYKYKIYDKLVYSQWRKAFGNKIKIIIVGGAALQPRLSRAFRAAGIKLSEGYGLTETSPVIAVNHENYPDVRFGTVGPIMEHIQVKITDDSEILVKGPNIMLGYYKDEKATQEAFDDEGWFKTGDIGEMIDNKFLKITDRKKEIFKLSTGLYITPQIIENTLKKSEYIDQIMVVGENEKFVSALIVPDYNILFDKAKELKISFQDSIKLLSQAEIIQLYDNEIYKYNRELRTIQQIKKFILMHETWSIDNGELSPTLKLKRAVIKKNYSEQIKNIYK
ncbi:MAG: long-chain fatty acid--CoA ligase, partial [Bacteroidales bacterium]|nr:long-chain fatty acid--CoA ligase [Bacteroidales bacterium]